ncbi:MAG: S8 family serine peptidase, partial [Euryarchaeota archaeon]|nr:S8 family serine peptidase [Euryarchaeota archaeon]
SDAIAGLEWCRENKDAYGIKVISMSLGDNNNNNGATPLGLACDAAVDAGIVICVAAGNDGESGATVGDPACAKKVITVGSINDSMAIASSSSRGPTADDRIKPEVCAVGVNVESANTIDEYATMSGTSMATPHVAGAAALMIEYNPDLTPTRVRKILMDTATDRGTSGPDNDYGWGVVNTTYAISRSIDEHDISVLHIGAPRYAEPNRTVTIDATIRNIGLCNESNLAVSLLLDGAELNQTTIPFIRTKEGVDLEFSWLPEMAGVHNLSVYASPVDNETLLDDNVRCTWINVSHNPDIRIDPVSYDFTLRPNSSVVENLTIGNSGTRLLTFDIIGRPNYRTKSTPYQWIDGVGEDTNLYLGDDSISNQNLSFVFNFYGRNYTAINISSDGWVSFTSGDEWKSWMYDRGPSLPVNGWENTIFPLGADWDPGSGDGAVYAKSYSQMYVITWHQVPHWYDGVSNGSNTFEMVLYETGEIEFNYKKIENPETYAVGLNLGDGLHGISCEDEPPNTTSLRFKPEEWLSVGTERGTIQADDEIDITIGIDTADLDVGSYSADILITSNDPDESSIMIPVDILVRRWCAADAAVALEIAVGSREYDPGMDVIGDGQVTSLDALMILQAAAGNIGM